MKRASLLISLFLLSLLVIAGCGSGGGGSSQATGKLTVAAAFPDNGQAGKIGTALLDSSTARIKVEVVPAGGVVWNTPDPSMPYNGYYSFTGAQSRSLTAASPSTTFSNLPLGQVFVLITAFDATGKALDQVRATGTIVEGSNALTATMLRGRWTFSAPLAFNKTMASDTTTISGFGTVSVVGMPKTWYANMTSLRSSFRYQNESSFWAEDAPMGALFQGNFSNYTTGCKGPQVYDPTTGYSTVSGWDSRTMCGSELYYINYFKGGANYNTIEGGYEIPLKPDMNYPKGFWPGDSTNRYAFVMGNMSSSLRPPVTGATGSYSTSFSDPSILTSIQNNHTRVTGAGSISGTMIEAVTKWYSSSRRCYSGTTEVSCSQQMYKPAGKAAAKKTYQSAFATALWKRMAGIGTAAADASGCYKDLQVTSKEEYTYQQYAGVDPGTQQPIFTDITVKWTDYEHVDACMNQFAASGAQASAVDISIADQITDFYFGQYY